MSKRTMALWLAAVLFFLLPRTLMAGEFFQGCGTLQIGPQGCTIFAADLPGGGFFAIENTGDFFIGDFVFVAGAINPQSTLCLPVTLAGIEDNLIASCSPPEPFASCGTLQMGPQGCPVFLADDGSGFFIENTGDFFMGARVYVEGIVQVAWACPPLPPTPALLDNTIEACFTECGTLVQGAECVLFEADSGGLFVLEDLGGFHVGDDVWVSGVVDPECNTTCQQGAGCIQNNLIEPCFSACGLLFESGSCVTCLVFYAENTGQPLVLEHLDGFGSGDRVFVRGRIDEECVNPCQLPCLKDNTIAPCASGCGVLVQGAECVLFAADTGGVFRLDDSGSFGVGDRVYVTGGLDEGCVSTCFAPCISTNTIEACFSECGEFGGVTQGCVLFRRDNGELLALENIGDFELPFDERVYVSGLLAEQVFFCFPWPGPGVEDNIAGACFSACGRLVEEDGCVLLATADGAHYSVNNRGIFTVGDRIRVSGVLDEACDVPCPLSEACVFFNTVADAAGDANCDGTVDIADLLLVILGWGPCPALLPCPGDLTGDGVVSVADLIEVLDAWSTDS